MKFNVTYCVQGGVRNYGMAGFEVDDTLERPLNALESYGMATKLTAAAASNIQRASGYAYLNSFINEGSVGAEIGVDFGDGALRFLIRNPSRLYLVDPWKPTDAYDPWTDTTAEEMERRYKFVVDRFKLDDRVVVCRQTSALFFGNVPDGHLDWVYIDGDHGTSAVYKDLLGAFNAVKPGGIISGDDLYTTKWNTHIRAGLDAFLKEHGEFVDVVWDKSDPFILRRK